MLYRVIRTEIDTVSYQRNTLVTTNDHETALFHLMREEKKDKERYTSYPIYKLREAYVVRPDRFTTISVEIHASGR